MRVGRLTKAHGLKGALKVELYTDDPSTRFTPGAVFTLQVPDESPWAGKTLELAEMRWYNQQPVAFFVGIDDRTAAETLVKAILWVSLDPDALPEEENAWYDHQLVGLRVLDGDDEVGRVARVDHFPAQDLLVVTTPSGEVLVPFVAAIVPSVDVVAGTVTVTPPPGLFEMNADADSTDNDSATAEEPSEVDAAGDGSASVDDDGIETDAVANADTGTPDDVSSDPADRS
ncbi:ribosome maturation factor RimM [Labedella endophytica]|uniref:Ribosome maturation factor RimM n=1 Tax=Labedella endophytica TaxID=1523160 RepID=A0A3S0XKB1_9MICO|nr:ribosome maturation factor RimM [Labedella endophytica]